MKLLTVLTTVLAVPSVIGTFYGMNVVLPGQHHPHAFGILVTLSTALTELFVCAILRKRLM